MVLKQNFYKRTLAIIVFKSMLFGHCCMGISLKIIPQLYYAYELVKDITNIPVTNWGTMLIMPLPSVFQNILFE